MAWQLLVEAGLLVGDFVYHRWFDSPPKPPPARELTTTRVDAGAPYALIFGRCRVGSAVLAWNGDPIAKFVDTGDSFSEVTPAGGAAVGTYYYCLSQFLVLGIPFADGAQKLFRMWSGDAECVHLFSGKYLSDLDGNGDMENIRTGAAAYVGVFVSGFLSGAVTCAMQGAVEFLNGNSSQVLVDPATGNELTQAGKYMTKVSGSDPVKDTHGFVDWTFVPGYRGLLSVLLWNDLSDNAHWCLSTSTDVPTYSFEVSSLPAASLGPHQTVETGDGLNCDANPIDVIYDILTALYGKLGLDPSRIDLVSFRAAAATLDAEGHGFSRSFEGGQTAGNMIKEILVQIDAVLYEDTDGLIKLKLVRNDYDPATLPLIDPSNCSKISGFAAGGWTGVPNKVRVTYKNRQDSYRDGSGLAQSLANAVGQDGEVIELQLQMPGVCARPLADNLAARELAARSRPMIKCQAVVDRSFRNTVPGDVVKLTWPEWGISEMVFRVAASNRGTLESGKVTLSLIQDYYYVWRGRPPVFSGTPSGVTPGGFAH